MRIQNNTSNNINNTNFTGIKSIKYAGLYKKHPEYVNELVKTFKNNDTVMDFCKKYDVNVVFFSKKKGGLTESSIHIFYDNPAMNKFRKILSKIFGTKQQVTISAFGDAYQKGKSTQRLIAEIQPEKDGRSLLGSHIKLKDREIQNALKNKRSKTKQISLSSTKEEEFKNNTKNLDSTIRELIEKTK